MTDPAKDYPDFADLYGKDIDEAMPVCWQRIMDRIKAVEAMMVRLFRIVRIPIPQKRREDANRRRKGFAPFPRS